MVCAGHGPQTLRLHPFSLQVSPKDRQSLIVGHRRHQRGRGTETGCGHYGIGRHTTDQPAVLVCSHLGGRHRQGIHIKYMVQSHVAHPHKPNRGVVRVRHTKRG